MRRGEPWRVPLRLLPAPPWSEQSPTWRAAKPHLIAGALRRALARPSGNWYVLGASRELPPGRPFGRTVAGAEVVAWRRESGQVTAGPGACPHLGAPLCHSPVIAGRLVCHWHGLTLAEEGGPGWEPFPVHDDGVLVWVRLDDIGGEPPLPAPRLPERPRPEAAVDAVTTVVGACEPQDVLANRLDPWHGAWFHPYAFSHLTVVEEPDAKGDDRFVVEVAYRVGSRAAVPVRASFTAPEPRTLVMRIIDGEGAASVVETHATPLTPPGATEPRTAVIEAVVATSERPGFAVARAVAPLLRPLVRRAAARLWRDDMAYAQRRWELRSRGQLPGVP
ncbi:DUF5914 domain-containing protein [Streptomyces zagrosensis]|uniref:Nitrite reductase/ring-hydroxylating ferredoxin subunit n=1 Tax=Streptomyces zagrosensis TaxID=1042984 RepID=A0A7W9QID4_9ACTN|nr:DUF5914 domain-containing protein [Streptomyces zagrosensis]MBB5939762.1 nitrite reductase/ring-hydroxylating ferredoxin subunit [Streptomyces zagrosensis]